MTTELTMPSEELAERLLAEVAYDERLDGRVHALPARADVGRHLLASSRPDGSCTWTSLEKLHDRDERSGRWATSTLRRWRGGWSTRSGIIELAEAIRDVAGRRRQLREGPRADARAGGQRRRAVRAGRNAAHGF